MLRVLHSGEFFGELGLLHDTRRSADVVAVTYVDTYLLTRAAFTASLEDHPEQLEEIRLAATAHTYARQDPLRQQDQQQQQQLQQQQQQQQQQQEQHLAGERLSQTRLERYINDTSVVSRPTARPPTLFPLPPKETRPCISARPARPARPAPRARSPHRSRAPAG